MKKFGLILIALFSIQNAFAGDVIVGSNAESLFNELEGSFEYKYSAIVTGLRIDTVVRHDEVISCEKESTSYGNEKAIIEFKCERL